MGTAHCVLCEAPVLLTSSIRQSSASSDDPTVCQVVDNPGEGHVYSYIL